MIVRNLLMVTAIAISQIACSDVVKEDATRAYAFKQLKGKYADYESKSVKCHADMKATTLPDSVIEKLSAMPFETSDSLAYLSFSAIDRCSQPEYSQFMRLLLIVNTENDKNEEKEITEFISKIKYLSFSLISIYPQKYYDSVPDDIKEKLVLIPELQQSFEPLDAAERAWPKEYGYE